MNTIIRIKWSVRLIRKTLGELLVDLRDYYISSYPLLLIAGAWRRLRRRLMLAWVPRGKGRPSISEEVIDLILDMKRENKGWGALRISHELRELGIRVHKKTVARILRENGFVPPRTRMDPISWEAFYNHHKHIWQLDFTSVFDVSGVQVIVLGIIDFDSRRLISLTSTLHPTRDWLVQQLCNCTSDGFSMGIGLVVDNDGIYGNWIENDMEKYFGIQVYRVPHKQPWKNGRIERFFQSLKTEIFCRIEVSDESHVSRLCHEYQDIYNSQRPHQALDGAAPCVPISISPKKFTHTYQKSKLAGGLITKFSLAA